MPGMRSNSLNLIERGAAALDQSRDGGSAYALREFADNLARVGRNPELWPEFAQLYCLTPEDLNRKEAA